MFFLVDNKKKIIFGWSAKCGCSHVKRIFYFLRDDNINSDIHTLNDINSIPINIHEYTIIIIIRNPYERLLSGFLDKYHKHGQFRYMYKKNIITFNDFINELICENWSVIDKHHFTPQTSEEFNENKLLLAKKVIIYDLKNIDYKYIEELYEKKIPDILLNWHGAGPENGYRGSYNVSYKDYLYNLDIEIYHKSDVKPFQFYNDEIKSKIYKFYENDFIFFSKYDIKYII